jgi:phosphohistidine phosphatase
MKRLALLRHAKAKPPSFALADPDRTLSERGEKDAALMGLRLKTLKARPSLILTSPAKRASRTAQLVAEVLQYPREFMHTEPGLYMASPEEILAVIGNQDDEFSDLLLVGHNPGLTDLANRLLPELQLDNLPPGGVVAMDCQTARWVELGAAPTTLAYYDYPKNPELLVIED